MKKLLLTAIATSGLLATSAAAKTETNNVEPNLHYNLTANVGYVYNFATKGDDSSCALYCNDDIAREANGVFGGGIRFGWTHDSGLGLATDSLFFTSKWSSKTSGASYSKIYYIVSIVPSYRFSLNEKKELGIKVGLGIGVRSANSDEGVVIAPEIALEYDNGLFHADLSARYIHELLTLNYGGYNSTTAQRKSGSLAVFTGAGLGVNF